MHNLLSLKFPGGTGSVEITPPANIPIGGLTGGGGKALAFGLTLFLTAVILLSLGFIVYGGLNWIMSGGDKTKLESARRTIIYAILGLLLAFVSFAMVSFVGSILKVDFFKLLL